MHPLKPSANQASQSARQTHQFLPLRAFHHPPTTTTITPLSNCPILSPPRGCELRARCGDEPLCPLSCSHLPLSRYLVSALMNGCRLNSSRALGSQSAGGGRGSPCLGGCSSPWGEGADPSHHEASAKPPQRRTAGRALLRSDLISETSPCLTDAGD